MTLGADVGLKANKDCKSLISRIFPNTGFPSGTTQQKVVSFADYLFLSTFPHARQDLGSEAKSN